MSSINLHNATSHPVCGKYAATWKYTQKNGNNGNTIHVNRIERHRWETEHYDESKLTDQLITFDEGKAMGTFSESFIIKY